MKISGIDKDFEDVIYYLDSNGFKPFASCDGVEANHVNPNAINDAYIAFLKSPKIINLMAEFLKDRENFNIILNSEKNFKPYELYGNMISGTNYAVHFLNKKGERTLYFESIIKNLVEREENSLSEEQEKLEMLERVLEESSDSDLAFSVSLNGEYQPHMRKTGKINELTITTKSGSERVEGDVIIQTERDMEALASILSEKYNIKERKDDFGEYPETEFIMPRFDKCSCSIYFTDENFNQILEQIQYIRQIAHTIPTFEAKEGIGDDDELFDEYDYEEWDMNDEMIEEYMFGEFEEAPLSKRENILAELEKEAEKLSIEEQQIPGLNPIDNERI